MRNSKLFVVLLISVAVAGCASNRTGKGGMIGAGAGGVIGGIIGHQSGNTALGAIIGATVGGATGAGIGHYMDKQAEELRRDLAGAKVERVGEGIKITFASGILFDSDSTVLKNSAKENLNQLSQTLKKYEDTRIVIEGNTDSSGGTRYNQELSEDRAKAVENYLEVQGVAAARMRSLGNGEENPVADNGTAAGRRANRRVEVAIFADEKLKKAAETNAL